MSEEIIFFITLFVGIIIFAVASEYRNLRNTGNSEIPLPSRRRRHLEQEATRKQERFEREAASVLGEAQKYLDASDEIPYEPGVQHPAAQCALQKSGRTDDRLMDIGMLVYSDADASPALYRQRRIPDTVNYARPFVVCHTQQDEQEIIRFELTDAEGVQHFVDESRWMLAQGDTLVYPETWQPVRNLGDDPEGQWTLRVFTGGQLLAAHDFKWRDEGGGSFRGYLDGDGEISDDILAEINAVPLDPLSLDALLSGEADGMLD